MEGALNTKSSFSAFHVESTWQVLSKPHMNTVLPRQQEILLSSYAPCWELHQWFPHAVKAPTILSLPFIHPGSCLDTCCLWSNSPHCQHLLLSVQAFWTWYCHACQEPLLCSLDDPVIYLSKYLADAPFLPWCFYYIPPCAPTISAETFNSAAFRALLDKKASQFQDPAFQMLFVKRQLHKTPIHKQSYRSPIYKRPLCHSVSEFHELHQR